MPLIDRGALMEELRDMLCSETMSKHLSQDDCFSVRVGIKKAMQMVGNAPTIDPVTHGIWLNFTGDFSTAECDKCGEIYEVSPDAEPREDYFNASKQFYKFCHPCGCKMDGDTHA